jgi:16S rRNA A1518/A1519 N6-dimethyltransferase RsmA/KsgA/DIM1 with predicted DNA glycosylase/AP lyase activity
MVAAFKDRLDKPAVDEIMAELQLGETARAEELGLEPMLRLSEAVQRRLEK